jgi:hypothetical protein
MLELYLTFTFGFAVNQTGNSQRGLGLGHTRHVNRKCEYSEIQQLSWQSPSPTVLVKFVHFLYPNSSASANALLELSCVVDDATVGRQFSSGNRATWTKLSRNLVPNADARRTLVVVCFGDGERFCVVFRSMP